jgi:aminoglycoside phosphotransferase
MFATLQLSLATKTTNDHKMPPDFTDLNCSFPAELRNIIDNYDENRTTEDIGCSGAFVFRLEKQNNSSLYLKIQPWSVLEISHGRHKLVAEAERMKWLHDKLPVPDVVFYGSDDQNEYLLMTAIEGTMCCNWKDKSEAIKLLAKGLRLFHSIDITSCPFDATIDTHMQIALENMKKGVVCQDLISGYGVSSALELYDRLLQSKPSVPDLVLLHGDYCLPNILLGASMSGTEIKGYIDLGDCGVGDRYSDLNQATHSIVYNFGKEWLDLFYNEYGIAAIDTDRIDFHLLLEDLKGI